MNWHSMKTRLIGSYAVLLGLFLVETVAAFRMIDNASGFAILAVPAFLFCVFAASFMLLAKKHVLDPVLEIKHTVEGLSNGDFTCRSGVRAGFFGRELDDEFTHLSRSVNRMAGQVSGVVERIRETSAYLASATEELSSNSSSISDGAAAQSGQTSYLATAMEEMSATVTEVARNSQQASSRARDAREIAAKGGQVVNEAIAAMRDVAGATSVSAETIKRLGKSSEEIGTIVSVINDIADQTNLLALNAAIEAARAGEQGRGFAVVADEVRKLAERTTRATKEISAMINAIQGETSKAVSAMSEGTVKVENGVKLANEAGQALKEIVSGVGTVTDMIGQIATSAEEQSAATGEITRGMDSIAEVARNSVAATGEVSKATGELASLASELKELVSHFRTAKGKTDGPARVVQLKLRKAEKDPPIPKPAYTAKF